MQSRRSFFKRIAAAVAIVALAPEIAFKREIRPAAEWGTAPFWTETSRHSTCLSEGYKRWMAQYFHEFDVRVLATPASLYEFRPTQHRPV